MRFALYYAPAPDDPLASVAAAWLGRDPSARPVPRRPTVPGFSAADIEARTADARRYGFHATLKAPFRLRDGRTAEALVASLEAFAAETPAIRLSGLKVADLDGFFALVPAEPSPALQDFAASVVRGFEAFRAPLTADDVARRRPERLSARQRAQLAEFGYPFVFDDFQFHMTLTDRLAEAERPAMRRALEALFPPALLAPAAVDRLALFEEAEPGAPFTVRASFPLVGPRSA